MFKFSIFKLDKKVAIGNGEKQSKNRSIFPPQQWALLGQILIANCCASATLSCVVPFFPTEVKVDIHSKNTIN